MHDISELQGILNLTEDKIRYRIAKLGIPFRKYITSGVNNKLLIDDNGLKILQRVVDLEKGGRSVSEAIANVQSELDFDSHKPSEAPPDMLTKLIEHLEASIASLERQLEAKDREIERLHDLLNRQLPPSQQEIRERVEARVSRWERFKQFLRGV